MRWVKVFFSLLLTLAANVFHDTAVAQGDTESTAVDFYRDVQPIFSAHCVMCHGETQQLGGLRLDNRSDAERGGYSGASVRAETSQNELLKRITETDSELRMPKDRPALSPSQVQILRDWIEVGAPWPDPPIRKDPPAQLFGVTIPDWLVDGVERPVELLRLHPFFRPLLYVFLLFNVVVLLVERKKRSRSVQTTDQSSRLQRVGNLHYLIGYLLFFFVGVLGVFWGGWRSAVQELHQAEDALFTKSEQLNRLTSTSVTEIFGDPPIPFRPSHPPTLSRTYYRGNCERNPRLFNGGNYRTAELKIALVDIHDELLTEGSAVPSDGMFVSFSVKRSQGAAGGHFGETVIDQVCLADDYFPDDTFYRPGSSELRKLSTIREGEEWGVRYPLRLSGEDGSHYEGLIYVYMGGLHDNRFRGTPHYGIRYSVTIADGHVAAGSEIWMNFLFLTGVVDRPAENRIPRTEWLDYRPIPEIEGENSTDPKLLGLPR